MIKEEHRTLNGFEIKCFFDTEQQAYLVSKEMLDLLLRNTEKLRTYERVELEGHLFEMPCKPGETVFIVITKTREIKEHKVSKIILGKQHDQIVFNGQTSFTIWGKNWDEYFYKYVHLTREEAEQALQQIQEENKNEKN